MVLTRQHQIAIALAGACEIPPIGTPLDAIHYEDLCWAEAAGLIAPDPGPVWFGQLPLWAYSGDGSGDGSGYDNYKILQPQKQRTEMGASMGELE